MDNKDLFRSFNEIDDDIIERSEVTYKNKKNSSWLKWGTLAACFCLIITGIWIAYQKNDQVSSSDRDHAIVSMVILNDEYYYICGKGESSILQECGLPTELSPDLAGEHIAYLMLDENDNYVISDKKTEVELFNYLPQLNSNVYIIKLNEVYYAAIRHDENGYHGIN